MLPIILKKLVNIKSKSENYKLLEDIISPFIDELSKDKIKNQQKISETCHLGKFLIFFNGELEISKLSEKPDFILTNGQNMIGLEHQIIVDFGPKEREGFYKNIFDKAELDLKADETIPNFLANCYIKPYAKFKINQKEELIEIVKIVIKEYVLTDELMDNPIIDRIFKSPHSQKSINANLGGWWRKDITTEIIEKAIKKKEDKLAHYQKNEIIEQWLLLVIGSNGESSYDMDEKLKFNSETDFDKVYVLEDFNNNLFELK